MSCKYGIVEELRELDKKGLLDSREHFDHKLNYEYKNNSKNNYKNLEKDCFLKINLLESLLKNIPDSIYFKDKEGRFIELSKSKAEHLNFDKKHVIGKTDFDFYSYEDAKKMRDDDFYVMENEKAIIKEEKIKRPNGETAWISAVKAPRYNKEGKVVGIVGISRDIKNKKKAEIKLKESEERYLTIFENSAVGIMMTDEKENIISWNNFSEKLLAMDKEDLHMKPVKDLYPKEEWERIRNSNIREKGMQHHIETKMYKKNGDKLDVDVSVSIIKDKKGNITGSIGVIKDITDKKKTELELKDVYNDLIMMNSNLEEKVEERTFEIRKLLKQKDEFIYQLGHDLKTPLTPLYSLLPIVLEKEGNEQSKKYLSLAIENVNYMKNLVEKTLKLALLNSNSFKLDIIEIKPWDIIDKVITNLNTNLEKNNIIFKNKVKKNLLIKADKLRFEELMNNIISNSIKYTKEKGEKSIIVNAEQEENMIKFSIIDEGIGMTRDQIEKAFDEFFKADESRHDFNSSGLGLTISKRIVEKHGGNIWLESPGPGKGTTFYFTFKNEIGKNN
jgi:PAS domain S-box-containing protein